MNLANNLETSAFFFPDNPAVRQAGCETTYAQLNERASRIATGLISMGVHPGEHVGLCAANSADWIAFYFGVIKAGAVAVTLSSSLTENEQAILVSHSKARLMFTGGAQLPERDR
jgi:long-chain acyl-CoA synthetase